MTKYRLPAGYKPAASTPNHATPVEVIFVPGSGDTHFQTGTCYHEASRREGARWRVMGGDSVTDYGLEVLAWREQGDELKIVAAEPAPKDEDGYRRAIDLLAKEHMERQLDGERDERPQGVGMIAKLFDVHADVVQEDYRARSKQMFTERRR
jgi:hypothetical protein